MPGSIGLGTIGGVPIALHFSWFIIAWLITISLAAQFQATHPEWQTATIWLIAAITALLFFASLLAHELSHAAVARSRGLPVRSITLFALGGVATIEKDAGSAKTEFLIAIAGPIASFAIGFACIAVAASLGWSPAEDRAGMGGAVLGWLGSINVLLATFNLIPGYPLDGGRVLRAVLWWAHGDADRATRGAATVGRVVAGLFIAVGLLQFALGAGFGGLWLAFIGWFLLMAAQASLTQISVGRALEGVRVGDVMSADCVTVEPAVTVQSLVQDVLLTTGRRCVVVQDERGVVGLITPLEVRRVERARWADTTASDVMRPLEEIRTVAPATPVADALQTMAREDVNQIPVVADGKLKGIVTRGHIVQLLESRAELAKAS